uniref:Uncharacterized protein n=1 Tax=Arundo donax TaxID=35708 RepID=A0A0A9EP36_ARUDO
MSLVFAYMSSGFVRRLILG